MAEERRSDPGQPGRRAESIGLIYAGCERLVRVDPCLWQDVPRLLSRLLLALHLAPPIPPGWSPPRVPIGSCECLGVESLFLAKGTNF